MISWGDKNIQVFASKPTLDQYHIDQLMPEPNIGTFQSNNVGKKSSVFKRLLWLQQRVFIGAVIGGVLPE